MTGKKLSTWAAEHGVHYRTAMLWLHAGTLPVKVERTPGGHYRVVEENEPVGTPTRPAIMEARRLLRQALALLDQDEQEP